MLLRIWDAAICSRALRRSTFPASLPLSTIWTSNAASPPSPFHFSVLHRLLQTDDEVPKNKTPCQKKQRKNKEKPPFFAIEEGV